MKKLAVLAAGLVAALAYGALSALAIGGPSATDTLRVDDDMVQCPHAQYTSIQAAVLASGPNATIKVCPGAYLEQVRVTGHSHDGLTLESERPLRATIRWPEIESAPLALVDVNGADHVTLEGFVVTGPFTFPDCSPDRHEGILVENAFDVVIEHNHVTRIQNSDPALYRCQEGDAVAIGRRTGAPSPASAWVEENVIDEYQKNGVQVLNPGTFAVVRRNTITGSSAVQSSIVSNGVVVFNHAAVRIERNEISNHKYAPYLVSNAIILDEAPAGSSRIRDNLVFDNDYGIEADSEDLLEITGNRVFGNLSDGIRLCGDPAFGCGPITNTRVRGNRVTGNGGSGISLFDADDNQIVNNRIEDNGVDFGDATDGIRVDTLSSLNLIGRNRLDDNETHDCHDDSVGGGTGGTANAWRHNRGGTMSPAGIC